MVGRNVLLEDALQGVEGFVYLVVAAQATEKVENDSHIVEWADVFAVEHFFRVS